MLKINKKNINIFEVGVGDLFCSKSLPYWNQENYNITLFEPNHFLFKNILSKIQDFKNIKLYNIGISNEEKMGELVYAGVLSYLKDIPSPINAIYSNKLNEIFEKFILPVKLMKFDFFDKGDIDYLILGMEGSEFTIFETMVSKPHIILLHNYFANDYNYTFYKWDNIMNWINQNNYLIINGIPDIYLINKKSIDDNILKVN